MAKEYISARQAVWLSTVMVASTALLFLPTLVAQHARQDSWLAILLFTPLGGLYMAGTIGYLAGRHPSESLVPLSETLLSKPGGKITGLLLLVWLVFSTGLLTREFTTFVVGTFLQQTPSFLISLSLTLLVVYGVLFGLEVIARSNDLILPAALFIIFLLLVLSIPDMEPQRLRPFLAGGWRPVIAGGFAETAFMGEFILFFILLPFLRYPREIGRALTMSTFLLTGLGTWVMFAVIMVFGGKQAGILIFDFFSLARTVSLAEFIERLDPLIMIIWVPTVFVKVSLFLLAGSVTGAQTLGLKEYRSLVIPLAVIQLLIAEFAFQNQRHVVESISQTWTVWTYLLVFPLPLLLIAFSWLRGRNK